MLRGILRALMVTVSVMKDVGLGVMIGFGQGITGNKQRYDRSWKEEWQGVKEDISNRWHTTLRPKGYERPSEWTAEDIAKAQDEIRRQPVDMSKIKTVPTQAKAEVDRRYQQSTQPTVSNAPQMKM